MQDKDNSEGLVSLLCLELEQYSGNMELQEETKQMLEMTLEELGALHSPRGIPWLVNHLG